MAFVLKRSKEQTGGCGTLSLRVLGDPLPETLKYEYQQSTSVPAKQSTKWKNTNQETKGSTFMIDGLQPTATGGSLYVRVRLPTAKGWSNWTTTTFRISKKEFRKWEGSASEDDVENGVQVDAEDDEEEEPLSKRQKSKEAAELTPELTPAPKLAPNLAPEPAAVAIAAPAADTDAVPQPMDVSQLTDEQKQAILDLVKAKVKTVKEDCRQTLTNTDCDVGYGYTVTFRPKAAQQARDLFRWKGKAPLEGPRPSGTSEATLEAELQRVLGLARLASDSADSKRKAEQQTEQSLGPTSSSSVGATSAATTASASATTSAVAMQIDASQAYRSIDQPAVETPPAAPPSDPPKDKPKLPPAAPSNVAPTPCAPTLGMPQQPSASQQMPPQSSQQASVWEPERLMVKPKKLAVTENTLHLHWLPPESTIDHMRVHEAQFLIELHDHETKTLLQVR